MLSVRGVGESDMGAVAPGTTPADLMVQASHRALEDAGIELAAVDGVCAATTQLPMAPLNLAEGLGIRPRWFDGTNIGGSSFVAHLRHASAAIEAGLCSTVLIAYGSTQRLVGRGAASVQEVDPYDVVLVDLDEGFRMMSTVRGAAAIGDRVRVAFDGEVPVFEPC